MGILFAIFGLVLFTFAIVAFVAGAHVSWIYGHLGLGVLLLGYAGVTSAREFRELWGRDSSKRGARLAGNAAAQTAFVAVILALIAYLSVRHPIHADWTEGQVHSLTDGTRDVLAQIPEGEGVEILAFFQPGSEQGARQILERYTYESDRIRFRVVDPNRNPALATRHKIRSNGILIVCGGSCESASGSARLTEPTEQRLTPAVRSVISERKKVYFVTGHGEASPDDAEERGFSHVRDALRGENVEVSTVLLAREEKVPDDAAAIILAGPERPLQDRELELLDTYLSEGGSVLALVDPFTRTNLADQLYEWGIALGDDVIVDQQVTLFAGPQVGVQPIVVSYGSHDVTRKMGGNPTMFNVARSVRRVDGANGGDFVELASTGTASWAETDTERFRRESVVAKDDADRAGPIAIAAAQTLTSDGGREGRLIVVGDSDFGRNRYFAQFFNQDLIVNMVNWLVGEEEFITIDRKLPRTSTIAMTREQFSNFRYLSLFVLPEAILLWGILLWWRRRT